MNSWRGDAVQRWKSSEKPPAFAWNATLFLEQEKGVSGGDVRLLGWSPGAFLLITWTEEPPPDGVEAVPKIWLRYEKGECYRFSCRVLQFLRQPFPMALVSYPKEVYAIHLRRSPRIKVFLRAEICGLTGPQGTGESRKAVILDISRNGCLLLVDLKMLLGKRVWLRFHIPWTGDRFLIQGRVIRCEAAREGFQSGIEFLEMDEDQRDRFLAFLTSLEEGRPSPIIG